MITNVGTVDRNVRIGAGLILVLAALMGWIGMWGLLGVVLVATGVFRICPAYLPFGISTCATGTAPPK